VFGGMLAATFIATLFVPVFFYWLARFGTERRSTVEADEASA
jgi:HAE1 family hydrophobic/amphiphilic exporter-1/multidrug efflux pump